MVFIHSGNEYSAILRCGDVVRFESEKEALAAQAMYEDVQGVLGRVQSDECRIRNSEREVTPHPSFDHRSKSTFPKGKAKKVRITIDPDVEFIGTPSTTSQAKRSPSLGDGGMKKALA